MHQKRHLVKKNYSLKLQKKKISSYLKFFVLTQKIFLIIQYIKILQKKSLRKFRFLHLYKHLHMPIIKGSHPHLMPATYYTIYICTYGAFRILSDTNWLLHLHFYHNILFYSTNWERGLPDFCQFFFVKPFSRYRHWKKRTHFLNAHNLEKN